MANKLIFKKPIELAEGVTINGATVVANNADNSITLTNEDKSHSLGVKLDSASHKVSGFFDDNTLDLQYLNNKLDITAKSTYHTATLTADINDKELGITFDDHTASVKVDLDDTNNKKLILAAGSTEATITANKTNKSIDVEFDKSLTFNYKGVFQATHLSDGSVTKSMSDILTQSADLSSKLDKENPTGTGSLSLDRKANTTVGGHSTTVGYNNTATAGYSFAEGLETEASGNTAHAEGEHTTASGYAAHAEGQFGAATGDYSHAEGKRTTASGICSHTEGGVTTASGNYSHAEGQYTTAANSCEHASGAYNISHKKSDTFGDAGNTLFSVGNGDDKHRQNAFEIFQDGHAVIQTVGTEDNAVVTKKYVDSAHPTNIINGEGTFSVKLKSDTHPNIANGKNNTVFGANNSTDSDSNFNTIAGTNATLTSSSYNIVSGSSHSISQTTSASIFGNSHTVTNSSVGLVSGTNNQLLDAAESIVGGEYNTINRMYTFAYGWELRATPILEGDDDCHKVIIGKFNNENKNAIFEVGNGDSDNNRHNAFEVFLDGHIETDNAKILNTLTATNLSDGVTTKLMSDVLSGSIKLNEANTWTATQTFSEGATIPAGKKFVVGFDQIYDVDDNTSFNDYIKDMQMSNTVYGDSNVDFFKNDASIRKLMSYNPYYGTSLLGTGADFRLVGNDATYKFDVRIVPENASTKDTYIVTVPAKTGKIALTSDIPSLTGYATESWINSKGFLTSHQSLPLKLSTRTGATQIPNDADINTTTYLTTGRYWIEKCTNLVNAPINVGGGAFIDVICINASSIENPSTVAYRQYVRTFTCYNGKVWTQQVEGTGTAGQYTFGNWIEHTGTGGGGAGTNFYALVDYNSIPASGQTSSGNAIAGTSSIQGNSFARSKPSGYDNIVVGRSKNNSADSGTVPDVSGAFNLSFGNKNTINGVGCLAIGGTNHVGLSTMDWTGISSSGFDEDKLRLGAVAFGINNISSGKRSFTSGIGNKASEDNAIAFGYQSESNGKNSISHGYECFANSSMSHAEGVKTYAGSFTDNAGWCQYATTNTITRTVQTNGIISINDSYVSKGAINVTVSNNTTDSSSKTITAVVSGASLTEYNDALIRVDYSINNNIIRQTITSNTFTKTVSTPGIIHISKQTTDKGTINVTVSNNTASQSATNKTITVTISGATISSGNPASIDVDWYITDTPAPQPSLPYHYTGAHAEGERTQAVGVGSHAEGYNTAAFGNYSHSNGNNTITFGDYSFTAGNASQARGNCSTAFGNNTIANLNNQFVVGSYNDTKTDTIFEVGNGNSVKKSNAFEVTSNGTIRLQNFNSSGQVIGYMELKLINGVLTVI